MNAKAAYKAHVRDLLLQYDIGPYSEEYSVGVIKCWNSDCGVATPVFSWGDDIDEALTDVSEFDKADNEIQAPPTPKPRTVEWIYSRTMGSSDWGNHCAKCGALQGDFFLFTGMIEYMYGWFEENGDGVGFDDLGNVGLYMSDL